MIQHRRDLVGLRVAAAAHHYGPSLGLGVCLGNLFVDGQGVRVDTRILLDSGKEVLGSMCFWHAVLQEPIPQIVVKLGRDAQVWGGNGNFLRPTAFWMMKGQVIILRNIRKMWVGTQIHVGADFVEYLCDDETVTGRVIVAELGIARERIPIRAVC